MEKQELNVNEIYTINGVNYRLNEDLELIELTKSIYGLQNGDKYYRFASTQDIYIDEWDSHPVDTRRLELGNVFLTNEEAQFELERRYTIAKIKKWKYENDDFMFTKEKYNYYIIHDFDSLDNNTYVACREGTQILPSWFYFSSGKKAWECLNFIGKENWKKYVLEIKE